MRTDRTEVVLKVLAVAGIITVALIAPNCVQLFDRFTKRSKWRRQTLYGYRQVVNRLKDQGLIEFRMNNQGVRCAVLTDLGRDRLRKYELGKIVISKPRHWDGKYRIIIFDIKEWKRGIRDELRNWLERLGFIRLQNSVWVYPYECVEVITLIKSHFKIGREVLAITAEQIENDGWLKREFGLA